MAYHPIPRAIQILAVLIAAVATTTPLSAQDRLPGGALDRRLPSSTAEMKLSFASVVTRAAPAVVNIYAARRVETRNPLMDDPMFRRFFGEGMPREQVQRSLGSGVIVDAAGFFVTNNHVIEGATEIKAVLADKREFEAEIVLKDARTDLAVLKLRNSSERFAALEFGDSDGVQVGDLVLAIGNPFGVGQTVTHGIVSALARNQVGVTDYQFFIQTDAAINPGNSGGALVDMSGRVIGINTAIFSRSGGSQGIGFAIPSNMVRVVVTSARGGGTAVKRPWLGARLQKVTPDIAENMGLKRPAGALVASVAGGSPAARAGLKTGDLIVSIDELSIDDPSAFDYRFATKPIGANAQIAIMRGGREVKLAVALEIAPELSAQELVTIMARSPFQGSVVANLGPAMAEELRLDFNTRGVAVIEVSAGTPAQMLGLQKGDVIVAVNGLRLDGARDLDRLSKTTPRVWRIEVNRGGKILTTVVSG